MLYTWKFSTCFNFAPFTLVVSERRQSEFKIIFITVFIRKPVSHTAVSGQIPDGTKVLVSVEGGKTCIKVTLHTEFSR